MDATNIFSMMEELPEAEFYGELKTSLDGKSVAALQGLHSSLLEIKLTLPASSLDRNAVSSKLDIAFNTIIKIINSGMVREGDVEYLKEFFSKYDLNWYRIKNEYPHLLENLRDALRAKHEGEINAEFLALQDYMAFLKIIGMLEREAYADAIARINNDGLWDAIEPFMRQLEEAIERDKLLVTPPRSETGEVLALANFYDECHSTYNPGEEMKTLEPETTILPSFAYDMSLSLIDLLKDFDLGKADLVKIVHSQISDLVSFKQIVNADKQAYIAIAHHGKKIRDLIERIANVLLHNMATNATLFKSNVFNLILTSYESVIYEFPGKASFGFGGEPIGKIKEEMEDKFRLNVENYIITIRKQYPDLDDGSLTRVIDRIWHYFRAPSDMYDAPSLRTKLERKCYEQYKVKIASIMKSMYKWGVDKTMFAGYDQKLQIEIKIREIFMDATTATAGMPFEKVEAMQLDVDDITGKISAYIAKTLSVSEVLPEDLEADFQRSEIIATYDDISSKLAETYKESIIDLLENIRYYGNVMNRDIMKAIEHVVNKRQFGVFGSVIPRRKVVKAIVNKFKPRINQLLDAMFKRGCELRDIYCVQHDLERCPSDKSVWTRILVAIKRVVEESTSMIDMIYSGWMRERSFTNAYKKILSDMIEELSIIKSADATLREVSLFRVATAILSRFFDSTFGLLGDETESDQYSIPDQMKPVEAKYKDKLLSLFMEHVVNDIKNLPESAKGMLLKRLLDYGTQNIKV